MKPERVTATVTVKFDVEANGRVASVGPESTEIDLTDLFRARSDSLARHMMPMEIEAAAGTKARQMLAELGLQP